MCSKFSPLSPICPPKAAAKGHATHELGAAFPHKDTNLCPSTRRVCLLLVGVLPFNPMAPDVFNMLVSSIHTAHPMATLCSQRGVAPAVPDQKTFEYPSRRFAARPELCFHVHKAGGGFQEDQLIQQINWIWVSRCFSWLLRELCSLYTSIGTAECQATRHQLLEATCSAMCSLHPAVFCRQEGFGLKYPFFFLPSPLSSAKIHVTMASTAGHVTEPWTLPKPHAAAHLYPGGAAREHGHNLPVSKHTQGRTCSPVNMMLRIHKHTTDPPPMAESTHSEPLLQSAVGFGALYEANVI